MAMWPRTGDRVREYGQLPLFAGCSRSQRHQVARAATRLSPAARTVLVREGARRRQFVIVLDGTAEVWRHGQLIDEIGAGGFFGEITLVQGGSEPATVVAATAMTVDVIARREFATLYADIAPLGRRIDHELDRRPATWIAASDARPPRTTTALTFPLPTPAGGARRWAAEADDLLESVGWRWLCFLTLAMSATLLDRAGRGDDLVSPPLVPSRDNDRIGAAVTGSPALDHIALTVPNLDDLVERLTSAFGMVATLRSEHFAVVVDPGSDFKLELSASDDGEAHVRHLGFRTDDVDAAHADLVAAGMETRAAPHRQDFASMYTSYLRQPEGVELQLVKYD
jgi:hypothetical protein